MSNKVTRASFLLFPITILSKVAAFFVTIVFSYYFGTNTVTDAYYAAGTIPNLVNNSLTICALTLFIPVYIKCKSEAGDLQANEFTSNVLNAFVTFNFALFIAVSLAAPVLAKLVAPGFSEEGLMHTQRMIHLLSMSYPFTVAAQALNNLCNANQKYVLPAVLTLLNHILTIVFCIVFAPAFGIYSYPLICTGAWIVQVVILYLCTRGRDFEHKIKTNFKDRYFKYMIKQSVPVMVTTAADQINLAADNIIGSDLPSGSLSCLGYAHRVFNSINGIVTSTLLTIYYPIISKQYAQKDTDGLNRSLKRYFEIMLLLTLPTTLFMIGNAKDVIGVLFSRGAMKTDDVSKISTLFMFYVAGILFMSIKEFTTRLFYILGDTKWPAVLNTLCIAINIGLSILLKQFIGIYGIAIATVISTAICAFVECLFLVKRAGGIKAIKRHKIINEKGIMQIVVSCCIAMGAMLCVQNILTSNSRFSTILISGMVYIAVAFFILLVLKNEYAELAVEYLFKRIGREKPQ